MLYYLASKCYQTLLYKRGNRNLATAGMPYDKKKNEKPMVKYREKCKINKI